MKITRRQFFQATGAVAIAGMLPDAAEAAYHRSSPRTWTGTGEPHPALKGMDAAVQAFMQHNSVRAGTVAVSKNGVLRFTRAYTWALQGHGSSYPIAQPWSIFRLASVSKVFTCAAIQAAYDANLVTPSTRVFPLLGITRKALASQTVDPYIKSVTVQNLVDHAGGWNDHNAVTKGGVTIPSSHFDPVFKMRYIARALQLPGPVGKRDMACTRPSFSR